MEFLNDFALWAWERHHNPLSWYIRPLFLIPFCYFAYKRNWPGIIITLIGLATSMFWFPAPGEPSQVAIDFLAAEYEYLTSAWTPAKILIALMIPVTFTLLGMAFWRRSWWMGLAVINFMLIFKAGWSIVLDGVANSVGTVIIPSLISFVIINAGVFLFAKWYAKRHQQRPAAA